MPRALRRLKEEPTQRLPLLRGGRDPAPHFDPAHSPIPPLVLPRPTSSRLYQRRLVGRGYARIGKSIEPVRGEAWAGVALDVSGPQQLIDQAIAFAPSWGYAYADCRSTHLHIWGGLP